MEFKKEGIETGARDVRRAAQALTRYLPTQLAPLARVAYNYSWVWHPDGEQLFRDIDAHRWRLCGQNAVRFLQEAPESALYRAAMDLSLVARAEALCEALEQLLARPSRGEGVATDDRPIAFFCAEFGFHRSMPVYSGGLGVLAGDILKEASDRLLPMVGVGLMYRKGYFHQRVDGGGWQHEYWYETDPERRACAKVTGADGQPITITVPIWDESVAFHIWRVDVGRSPLFLLDTELPENTPRARFITSRLYEGNRQMRLAQYTMLGVGGLLALDAMTITPGIIHMNEGHPATVTLELVGREMAQGRPFAEARESVRKRVVFTTHTPVPAGNETYSRDEVLAVMPQVLRNLGDDVEAALRLGRINPDNRDEAVGMTALAIRMSRSTNAVSKIHGDVSRGMWQQLFPGHTVETVPITHVTNGAHLPSWMSRPMRQLLDRYLPANWYGQERVADPATWMAVDKIPDSELWEVRRESSHRMAAWVRSRTVTDRLTRGDTMDYVMKAVKTFDPEALTLGFARRLASYKRLYLLIHDRDRLLRLLEPPQPVQLLFAGKAHPMDNEGKRMLESMFSLKSDPRTGHRVAFFDDYDIGLASLLTSGCDVWINLPRPPLEASGTSGMKAAFNGTLNLSVLDGWWAEAFDGTNGWGIPGTVDGDAAAQDTRDAHALYDILEREVVPLFYDRDADGLPRGWIARMKACLRTIGPRFGATRMIDDYVRNIYPLR